MNKTAAAGLIMMIVGVVLFFASIYLSLFAFILASADVIHPAVGTAVSVALFAAGNLLFTRG